METSTKLILAFLLLVNSRVALAQTKHQGMPEAPKPIKQNPKPAAAQGPLEISVSVTEKGFEPSEIKVKKGIKTDLVLTRTTDNTCATKVHFAGDGKLIDLPLNTPVHLPVPSKKEGTLKFGCSMKMMVSASVIVEK